MHQLTTTAFLSVLILLSGAIKLPSPFPGGEFQLSAPVAVLICACFGFKRYIAAGIVASVLGMLLGTANVFNVLIAMVFRLVAGGIIAFGGTSLPIIVVSGPFGTFAARLVLAQLTGISWLVLVSAAIPGMVFTAVAAGAMYRPAIRLLHKLPAYED